MPKSQPTWFHLGHHPDVGHVAGIPGVRPLELHGDRLLAAVADPEKALEALRQAGFPSARLDASPPSFRRSGSG